MQTGSRWHRWQARVVREEQEKQRKREREGQIVREEREREREIEWNNNLNAIIIGPGHMSCSGSCIRVSSEGWPSPCESERQALKVSEKQRQSKVGSKWKKRERERERERERKKEKSKKRISTPDGNTHTQGELIQAILYDFDWPQAEWALHHCLSMYFAWARGEAAESSQVKWNEMKCRESNEIEGRERERERERERAVACRSVNRVLAKACMFLSFISPFSLSPSLSHLNWCEQSESLARLFVREQSSSCLECEEKEKREKDWDDRTYHTVEWARQSKLDNEQKLRRGERERERKKENRRFYMY